MNSKKLALTSEHSPSWYVFSAGEEIPHLSWNLRVYYHVHKGLPLFSVLSKMTPVHA